MISTAFQHVKGELRQRVRELGLSLSTDTGDPGVERWIVSQAGQSQGGIQIDFHETRTPPSILTTSHVINFGIARNRHEFLFDDQINAFRENGMTLSIAEIARLSLEMFSDQS